MTSNKSNFTYMKTKLVVLLFSVFGFALGQNQKVTISKIENFYLNADAFYGYGLYCVAFLGTEKIRSGCN